MNFMGNKKILFAKKTARKKMKQSKLDGFLKNGGAKPVQKANRNAMLQEFFMGAGGPPKKTGSHKNTSADTTSFACSDSGQSRVVLAITEGRSNARGEVGLAAIDIHSPELILCQLSDDLWYSGTIIKIQMLNPAEVLLPNTFFNAKLSNSKLLTILRSTFPTVDFKETPRKHFHDFEALEKIERISVSNVENVKIALENKYYALASCNALLTYVGIAYFLSFAERSLNVVYESRYAAMTIDMETSKRLELVQTLALTHEKKTCLFTFMDHCQTRIGKRSLRARILEPFADLHMIRQCHEAIHELLEKDNYLFTLRVILKRFHQVDRLMKLSLLTSLDDSIKASEAMISLTLMLKNCLSAIPMLLDMLTALDSSVFVGIRAGLEDTRYQLVLDQIDRILFTNDPPQSHNQSAQNQRIYAVKPNVSQVLDMSRGFYAKINDEIAELAKEMSAQLEMSFSLTYNCSKGYQLSVVQNRTMLSFPEQLIVVSRKGNKVTFTTEKLNDLNGRMKRIVEDILVTSNRVISEMLAEIRQEVDVVYLLTGIITELDIFQSFATLTQQNSFVCPVFGQETKIVDAVHPFLEYGRLKTLPVPNQVIATPDHNLFVITGPNMGGKTVYIKMIACLQVMAQVGSFVPAMDAQFRICDKLFSRIGFEDSIDKGVSSFGMEVEQMSFILNNVTPNSLVIIDELGRGTNPEEGTKWAWKMCEKLTALKGFQSKGMYYVDDATTAHNDTVNGSTVIERARNVRSLTSPFVYITTHFMELTKLADKFLNVVNLHLVAEETSTNGSVQVIYPHRVQVGVTPLKEYGLALARTIKFPRKVIPKAEAILERIKSRRVSECIRSQGNGNESIGTGEDMEKEKLFYDLYASLASICRRASEPGAIGGGFDQELKGILEQMNGKCSQNLQISVRMSNIEDTLNQSKLVISSVKKGTKKQRNFPETSSSVCSDETKVSTTSWMTTTETPTEESSFKETRDEMDLTPLSRTKSPELFHCESLPMAKDQEMDTFYVNAGGDNSLRRDGKGQETGKEMGGTDGFSFFDNTQIFTQDPDDLWDSLQTQILGGEYPIATVSRMSPPHPPKPEINQSTYNIDNTFHMTRGLTYSSPGLDFGSPGNYEGHSVDDSEEFNMKPMRFNETFADQIYGMDPKNDSGMAFEEAKDSQNMDPGINNQTQTDSFTSRYNFRLGLIDLNGSEKKETETISQISSVASEPESFIAKYGRAIENNCNKASIVNKPRNDQRKAAEIAQELKEMLMNKDRNVQNPFKGSLSPKYCPNPLELRAPETPAKTTAARKQDYTEWLGQYCRSRVKGLGTPVIKKRPHNSTMRSSRSRIPIDVVNQRWASFYSTNPLPSEAQSSSSSSSDRMVSFSGPQFKF